LTIFREDVSFHCTGLNLKVSINGFESTYKADFIIKVVPVFEDGKIEPGEKVEGVYLDTIYLHK